MNIFPRSTNEWVKKTGYFLIIFVVIYNIINGDTLFRGLIDALFNGLFWWIIFLAIATFTKKSNTKNEGFSNGETKKKFSKLEPNTFLKREGILSVNDFFKEANLNTIRAEKKHIGKSFMVQGLVRDIYEDSNFFVGNSLYIVLSDLNELDEEFDKYIAKFSMEDKESVSELNIGDHIVISGSGNGFKKGEVNMYYSKIVHKLNS